MICAGCNWQNLHSGAPQMLLFTIQRVLEKPQDVSEDICIHIATPRRDNSKGNISAVFNTNRVYQPIFIRITGLVIDINDVFI